MANPLVSPDDDDPTRVGSMLTTPADVHTPILMLVQPIVSPENFTNFIVPRGWLEG